MGGVPIIQGILSGLSSVSGAVEPQVPDIPSEDFKPSEYFERSVPDGEGNSALHHVNRQTALRRYTVRIDVERQRSNRRSLKDFVRSGRENVQKRLAHCS